MKVIIEKKSEHCIACMKPNSSFDILVKFNNDNGSGIPLCKDCMKNLAQALFEKIEEDDEENRKAIYVTDLPKSCVGCNYFYHECKQTYHCAMQNKNFDLYTNEDYLNREKECPLKSLADYTKQVRKEVCDKVREAFKEIIFDNSTIDEILDQI